MGAERQGLTADTQGKKPTSWVRVRPPGAGGHDCIWWEGIPESPSRGMSPLDLCLERELWTSRGKPTEGTQNRMTFSQFRQKDNEDENEMRKNGNEGVKLGPLGSGANRTCNWQE